MSKFGGCESNTIVAIIVIIIIILIICMICYAFANTNTNNCDNFNKDKSANGILNFQCETFSGVLKNNGKTCIARGGAGMNLIGNCTNNTCNISCNNPNREGLICSQHSTQSTVLNCNCDPSSHMFPNGCNNNVSYSCSITYHTNKKYGTCEANICNITQTIPDLWIQSREYY